MGHEHARSARHLAYGAPVGTARALPAPTSDARMGRFHWPIRCGEVDQAMSTTRANCALISRAARMIQHNADCLHQCHAQNGDWGVEREVQQIHDEEVRMAKALRALIVAAPVKTPPKI